jgi:hypothetical protein
MFVCYKDSSKEYTLGEMFDFCTCIKDKKKYDSKVMKVKENENKLLN